jgi:hypothetical protein
VLKYPKILGTKMATKNNVLTNFLAHISMSLASLVLTLGLSFSAIKLINYAYNFYNSLPKSMDDLVNAFMLNSIVDGTLFVLLSIVYIVDKTNRYTTCKLSTLLKIMFIPSATLFFISSFFFGLTVSETATNFYYLLAVILGLFFIDLSIASISIAFMQNKLIQKMNKFKEKTKSFFNTMKLKKQKIKAESHLKQMAQSTEEKASKNKVEQISDAFASIKAHLNIADPIFKSDSAIARNINQLETTVEKIIKNSKNETTLADIKSLVFKSLPEIVVSYKDFTVEGSFQQNEEQKKLVIESLEQINQYFTQLLNKTNEEKMVEKSSDLSVKLEFAKKRFLSHS